LLDTVVDSVITY